MAIIHNLVIKNSHLVLEFRSAFIFEWFLPADSMENDWNQIFKKRYFFTGGKFMVFTAIDFLLNNATFSKPRRIGAVQS